MLCSVSRRDARVISVWSDWRSRPTHVWLDVGPRGGSGCGRCVSLTPSQRAAKAGRGSRPPGHQATDSESYETSRSLFTSLEPELWIQSNNNNHNRYLFTGWKLFCWFVFDVNQVTWEHLHLFFKKQFISKTVKNNKTDLNPLWMNNRNQTMNKTTYAYMAYTEIITDPFSEERWVFRNKPSKN